ncbi:outer membrane beta-barrel protein [Panacagrimonas sp.]|uniref:outer membrane beta-barrel protein n=1 Tax=Panacagrimonas sp. TaxID=2480088 RepID=UPI003B52B408
MSVRRGDILGMAMGLGLGASGQVQAALAIVPFVSGSVEYDNNVLRLPNNATALQQRGDPRREDAVKTYSVGVGADYSMGAQSLKLGVAANRTEYNRFTELDFEGHEVSGSLNWAVGSIVNGSVTLRDARALENFAGRTDAVGDRAVRDNTTVAADAKLRLLSRYEFRPGLQASRARYSLSTSQQQDLDEETLKFGLSYVGSGRGDIGLEAVVGQGDYLRRTPGPGVIEEYDQLTLQLVGTWQPSPITTFSFGAGSSRRDNRGVDVGDNSAFVGNLNVSRTVSVKTSLYTGVYRSVSSSELQGESTVVSTGWNVGGNWKPVEGLSFNANFLLQDDRFEDSIAVDNGGERRDDLQSASVSAEYTVRRWLVLKPYYEWEDRSAEIPGGSYKAYQAGLEVKLQFPAR